MDANQRYKLDVESLLRSVMSLEAQLAEQARQTTAPYWATDLISRITSLESSNENLQRQMIGIIASQRSIQESHQIAELSAVPEKQGDKRQYRESDATSNHLEPRIMDKIRYEYEHYVQTVRNTMDMKLNSLNVELERAYKLIQSRPTVTDFQHVMYQIQALESKFHENMNEFTVTMKSTIQDNISNEMSCIVNQLRANEVLNEQNFGVIFDRFDKQAVEVDQFRANMKEFTSFVQSNLDEINSKSLTVNAVIEDGNQKINSSIDEIKANLVELESNQTAATESYVDIKATISRRLIGLEEHLSTIESRNEEINQIHDAKITRINNDIRNLENDLSFHRNSADNENKKIIDHLLSHDQSIRELEEHGQALDDDMDVIHNEIVQTNTKISGINNQLEFCGHRIDDLITQFDKSNQLNETKFSNIEILEESLKKLKSDIAELCFRLDDTLYNSQIMATQIQKLQDNNNHVSEHVNKLESIWEATASLRALYEETSFRIDTHIANVDKISEAVNETKSKLNLVSYDVKDQQLTLSNDIQSLRDTLNEKFNTSTDDLAKKVTILSSKVSDMASTIDSINANPREFFGQVDALPSSFFNQSSMQNNNAPHHLNQHTPSTPNANMFSNNQSRRSSHKQPESVPSNQSISPKSVQSTSLPPPSPVRSRNPSSSKDLPDAKPVSEPVVPVQQQRRKSLFQPTQPPHMTDNSNSTTANSLSSGNDDTLTATKYSSVNCVVVLAELCQKYEDICVQRSDVLDFSEIMCESITGMSKRLASTIASDVDDEVVRGVIYDKNNQQIAEDAISSLRTLKVLKILEDIRDIVIKRFPHPGGIRLDSREKFFRKLKLAIDMWLSKFDQVFVIANSTLGRVRIPTCIACDRPLLKRERKIDDRLPQLTDRQNTPPKDRYGAIEMSKSAEFPFAFRNNKVDEFGVINNATREVSRRGARPGSRIASKESIETQPYVLRAGFKIPRNPKE